ncbi:MAG: Flp pilus assembly pilin Flp [Arenicella sp.]|jgi:Flp pilus assembly pilin Flp
MEHQMKQPLSIARIKASNGQGMTEYIIMVALIAIAAIGVYSQFGKSIRGQMQGITQEMGGVSADMTNVNDSISASKKLAEKENSLKNYNQTATSGANAAN